jgi:hypothetical protein
MKKNAPALKQKLGMLVTAAPDAYYSSRQGEVSVFSPSKKAFYTLNAVGTKVWLLLDGTHTLAEVFDLVARDFHLSCRVASRDVGRFISGLYRKGLVVFSKKRAP